MDEKNVTVQEAAEILHVRRERIWKLLHDGVLTARPSKLDRRRKLIPRHLVVALLRDEGDWTPRVTRGRRMGGAEPSGREPLGAHSRPWPDSIGMIADGAVPSSESEGYLRRRIESERSGPE